MTGTLLMPVLHTADPLPQPLVNAVLIVASDLSLPTDWLNSGPTSLLTEGLPEWLEKRLHRQQFGDRLTVYFIDRYDQICFKTYAIINGGGMRHLIDLRALQPTDDEILAAVQWSATQDAADFFPDLIRNVLRNIGYPDVADRL